MHQKIKRILALMAVAVILCLYLAVLVLSLIQSEAARELLKIAIVATVVLPVLLYIYFWLFRTFGKKDDEK